MLENDITMSDGLPPALSVSLALSLFLGVFPMKKVQPSTYVFSWKLYTYDIILGIAIILEVAYWMIIYTADYGFSFALFANFFSVGVNICTWTTVLVQFYLVRYSLPAIISELDQIHRHIDTVTYSRFCSASTIITIHIINAIPALFNILYRRDDWYYIILQLTYFVFTNVPVFVAGQYSVLMYIVSRQLFCLTAQLSSTKSKIETNHFVGTHNTLCDMAQRINQVYNIFLFQTITLTFVNTVLKIYIVIIYILKRDLYADEDLLFTSIIDVLVNCGVILLIVTAAMRGKNNADRFNAQLLKNVLLSKDLAKDDKLRTYLATNNTIKQTACEFFTLDYSLLTSMGAGTTTYVILLVQLTLL